MGAILTHCRQNEERSPSFHVRASSAAVSVRCAGSFASMFSKTLSTKALSLGRKLDGSGTSACKWASMRVSTLPESAAS